MSDRGIVEDLEKCGVPDYMWGGIVRWIEEGIWPGDFLTAVFQNNLVQAYGQADLSNQRAMPSYAMFLFNYAPRDSWGSKDKMVDWAKKKREERGL